MRCSGCGFNLTVQDAPSDRRCNACGDKFNFDSDDFLLRQHGAPGRDVRIGQVHMGRLVEQVLRENAICFVEAPVGSGKSDAYGVPAMNAVRLPFKSQNVKLPSSLLKQKEIKSRVVISTAKKNLQHQIAEKDLPYIRKRMEDDGIGIVLLKGKNNYACRLKAAALEPAEKAQFDNWIDTSETDDLSDFPGKRPFFLNDVTAEDCVGKGCKYAMDDPATGIKCGFWRSKQAAAKASIIVTNHHVVAFDLRFGPGVLLGPYTSLVIDEAHQAPSSFRGAFSHSVTQAAVKRIVRQIDDAGLLGGYPPALNHAWTAMFQHLVDIDGEIPKDPFGASGDEVQGLLGEISKDALKELQSLGFSSEEGFDISHVKTDVDREMMMSLLTLRKTIERTNAVLSNAKEPSDNTVLFVDTNSKMQKKLTLAPISVGTLVGPKLQMVPSVVFTSATMAVAGNFEDIKYQMGLNWPSYNDEEGGPVTPKRIHELILDTPFDYKKQAVLYTPRHIPLPVSGEGPARELYISVLANECARLIQASGGNAFVLFTARTDLKEVHAALQDMDLPYPLLVQEEDAMSTLKEYMATPNSVLMGVKSFWEGVDVQGQKLQLVIITKLPFPMMTDPVLQARARVLVAEQVAKGIAEKTAQQGVFSKIQIPHMLTELRQGAGRLIRSKTDKGVLAILDARVFTGSAKEKPLPDQKTYRGYGKLAVDATGFKNHILEFEVIQRIFAQWNERTKAASTT